MTKTYSNTSNAKRAAKAVVDKYPALLDVAPPERTALGDTFYATVAVKPGAAFAGEIAAGLADAVKFATNGAASESTAKTKPAAKAKRAPKATVTPAKATKASTAPAVATGRKSPAGSKVGEQILALIADGAVSTELQAKFSWAPHTLRGFISTTNKKRREAGLPVIVTERAGKVTTYSMGAV